DAAEQAVARGLHDGLEAVRPAARDLGDDGDDGAFGWRPRARAPILAESGSLTWAARSYVGLGAPLAEDLLPPTCRVDESSRPLSGLERYRLRFAPGAHPPVRAFWALSVGRPDAHDRPFGRIDDRSGLVIADDGALE